jgi:hypothetical protein
MIIVTALGEFFRIFDINIKVVNGINLKTIKKPLFCTHERNQSASRGSKRLASI